MLNVQAVMTGSQWPYEAVTKIGDINQRTLDQVADLQLNLIQRNLDVILELSGKTAGLWMESVDEYLSLYDRIFEVSLDKPAAVTHKVKVTKKRMGAAINKAKPKTSVARKRPSKNTQ